MKIAFFGSSRFSVFVLESMIRAGFVPASIVTTPDKPQGRGMRLQANLLKEYASNKGLSIYDPAKLNDEFIVKLQNEEWDLFIVASYGKIIPDRLLNIPKHKTLNVHPSLLPKYRGASPLQSAILNDDKHTGITIMRIDAEMDHGPIVAQVAVDIEEWPIYEEFEEMMASKGGLLLAETITPWMNGAIKEKEQDHTSATYTKKIKKEDALIDLSGDQRQNFLKIQAYHEWPQAYFFIKDKNGKDIRIKVTKASYRDGKLTIERVIPEGRREIEFGKLQIQISKLQINHKL